MSSIYLTLIIGSADPHLRTVHMQSHALRAPLWSAAISGRLERQLQRYRTPFQGSVRALAVRHSRIADLAVSFPALLFALAVPRSGLDPARAIERAIEGAALAEVAAAADVPMWLRRLPPEAMASPIMPLPDGEPFRQQIANHLPRSPKRAPIWLQTVAAAADLADETFAIWMAREIIRESKRFKLAGIRLLCLWAWFSGRPGTFGHAMIAKPWMPAMRIGSALDAAGDWRVNVDLNVDLGRTPIADIWLQPARVDGYDFLPLTSPETIAAEAAAMRNCLRSCSYNLAHNRLRLWSICKDGQRVATLSVGSRFRDPLPNILELRAAGNAEAPKEIWWAARRWLHMHDLPSIEMNRRAGDTAPLDRAVWLSLWRPYWLAKRRIPEWLPLAPSRTALIGL